MLISAVDGIIFLQGGCAMKNRSLVATALICMTAIAVSAGAPAAAAKKASSQNKQVKLNYSKVSVSVTNDKQLTLKKLSKKQKNSVKWSSADETIATVSKTGLVRTWKPGKTSIKAKYKKKTYTCRLTVTGPDKGVFYLQTTDVSNSTEAKAPWVYKDKWFTGSFEVYEKGLARLSALLCMASGPARGKSAEEQSFYLKRCLTALGFDGYYANDDYRKAPEKDTLGVAFATKKIKSGDGTYSLIAVVPRSAGYGNEWLSNLTLGYGPGDHEGFTGAKEKILSGLNLYLADMGITGDIKLWFAGHSRGAAACNLAEAYLADHPESLAEGVSLKKQDIYGYNLSTIHGAGFSSQEERDHLQKDYPFIHNIELPYDIFTTLVPAHYGFDRYGVTHVLEYTSKEEKEALEVISGIDPALYKTYSEHVPSEHGVADLKKDFVDILTQKIPDRKTYVDEWQQKMGDVKNVPDLLPVFLPVFIDIKTGEIDIYAATIQHYSTVLYCFLSVL